MILGRIKLKMLLLCMVIRPQFYLLRSCGYHARSLNLAHYGMQKIIKFVLTVVVYLLAILVY